MPAPTLIAALALAASGAPVNAPPDDRPGTAPAPGFHFVQVEGERGPVKGAVYVPRDLDTQGGAPAIVFLHGYGESGTDGTRMLGVGLPQAIIWNPERWPFVVVIPQKPVFDTDWDDYADAVLAMLDLAVADFAVDPDRVAITGLSQGGHATIAIATAHPDRFVAAAPVCGYTARRFVEGERRELPPVTAESPEVAAAADALRHTPVWLFHGGVDDVVPPAESEALHEALLAAGSEHAKLTIFPKANHNSWDPAYRESGVWDWFAEHLRPD